MVLQYYQNLKEMTSNTFHIVAFVVGFKCPRKIHLNTQWGGDASRTGGGEIECPLIEPILLLFLPKFGLEGDCPPDLPTPTDLHTTKNIHTGSLLPPSISYYVLIFH